MPPNDSSWTSSPSSTSTPSSSTASRRAACSGVSPVLDAAAREEVVRVPVAHAPDQGDAAVLDDHDPRRGAGSASSRNASSAAQRGSATVSSCCAARRSGPCRRPGRARRSRAGRGSAREAPARSRHAPTARARARPSTTYSVRSSGSAPRRSRGTRGRRPRRRRRRPAGTACRGRGAAMRSEPEDVTARGPLHLERRLGPRPAPADSARRRGRTARARSGPLALLVAAAEPQPAEGERRHRRSVAPRRRGTASPSTGSVVVVRADRVDRADAGRSTVSCERSCSRSRPRRTADEELVEVDLERREDPVGPVLHLEPRLARLPAGVVDDVLRLPLGDLDDLGLRASRTACSRASPIRRSHSRLASASISCRSLTIQRACLISSGIVARIWSRMS